eukprot:4112413-Amphidinium_carterae.1
MNVSSSILLCFVLGLRREGINLALLVLGGFNRHSGNFGGPTPSHPLPQIEDGHSYSQQAKERNYGDDSPV